MVNNKQYLRWSEAPNITKLTATLETYFLGFFLHYSSKFSIHKQLIFNLTLDHSFKVKLGRATIKVLITHFLLVLEVCNVQSTCRKSFIANHLVSNLTLDHSFKVKLWRVNIKVPLSHLLLVLEVSNVQSTFKIPQAVNFLVVLDLTLDRFFKVKLWLINIKVPIKIHANRHGIRTGTQID